jgi:hypothetical protein
MNSGSTAFSQCQRTGVNGSKAARSSGGVTGCLSKPSCIRVAQEALAPANQHACLIEQLLALLLEVLYQQPPMVSPSFVFFDLDCTLSGNN